MAGHQDQSWYLPLGGVPSTPGTPLVTGVMPLLTPLVSEPRSNKHAHSSKRGSLGSSRRVSESNSEASDGISYLASSVAGSDINRYSALPPQQFARTIISSCCVLCLPSHYVLGNWLLAVPSLTCDLLAMWILFSWLQSNVVF